MNRLPLWKRVYIITYKLIIRLVYKLLSYSQGFDENLVVIALYRTKELEGNTYYIYKELQKQLPNAKIHFVLGENKMNLRLFKEIKLLAKAHYLILDDYYLPVYLIKPNKKLKVIQLWHAAGAFKKFGYSTVGTRFGPDPSYLKLVPIHSAYTHVYVSSKHVVDYYAEAFNVSKSNIHPIGVPRTDLFHQQDIADQKVKDIFVNYPFLEDESLVKILIAPTYRAKGPQGESSWNFAESLNHIAGQLDKQIQIIFKAHPYMEREEIERLRDHSNVFIADQYEINEWMLIADGFITDYSSSIFEFALLKRPLAHYVPDINEYKKNRGFYQELSTISDGVILEDEMQLINWINTRQSNEYFDSSRMIKLNFDETENVSAKIVNHFL